MQETDALRDDFDGPWKEALAEFFEEALELLAPELHALIDWRREVVFLDKELQRFLPETGDGKRHVDKLARVYRRDGVETLVLIHVEVQADPDASFPERMFRYSYRSFDAFDLPVESLAILADSSPNWRPDHYAQKALCSSLRLEFTAVKLLDLESNLDLLEQSGNPFAVFVIAHLRARRTRPGEDRLYWKTALIRSLFSRGFSRARVASLFHLVDWLMKLPPELDRRFLGELRRIEEEENVKHDVRNMGSATRLIHGDVRREAILKILEARFGPIPSKTSETLEPVDDLDILDRLISSAAVVPDLASFARELADAVN